MNMTGRDVGIIISMVLAVVAISFVFPALGLTGDEPAEPPEFSIDDERFDFTGDFPANPGTPDSGTVTWDGDDPSRDENRDEIGTGSSGDRVQVFTQSLYGSDDTEADVQLWSDQSSVDDVLLGPNDEAVTHELEGDGYEIDVVLEEYEVVDTTNADDIVYYEIDWQIVDDPDEEGSGWTGHVPGLSTAIDTGESIAGVVGWIGTIIWWGVTWLFQIAGNLLGMLYDVASFIIGLLSWLTGEYTDVIDGADGWAVVFVSIPGVILSLLLSKFVMIAIALLPTT